MKRRLNITAALLITLAAAHGPATAFPDGPITLVVPFGPGGTTDLIGRALAPEMARTIGQQVVVLNRAGAGGAIGAAEVAKAKADGYTLGMLPSGPLTTQPGLRKLSYTPASFDPICRVYSNPLVLMVRNDSPFKTLQDLVAAAKRNPGKLNYASTGTGSVPHLALAALDQATGIAMVHVPYKGEADMLLALLGGQVAVFAGQSTMLSTHGESIRGLGVMSPNRLKAYPDLPTLAEEGGPPLDFEVWGGLVAPKGTPPKVLAALEQACRVDTSIEAFQKRLDTLTTPVNYMDSKAFGAFINAEFSRNVQLLHEAGIKAE